MSRPRLPRLAALLLAAVSCIAPTGTDAHGDRWNAYPWDSVRISGPIPSITAFLAPGEAEVPGWFRSVLVVTNHSSESIGLLYGPCAFGLRIYSSPRLSGQPLWHDSHDACDAVLIGLSVPPGETRTRPVFGFVHPDTLARTLPAGRYSVAVTWRTSLDEPVQVIFAGSIDVPRR